MTWKRYYRVLLAFARKHGYRPDEVARMIEELA